MTGDPRFDAALAALVAHHLGGAGLPVPAWGEYESRFLAELWFPDDIGPRGSDLDVPAAFHRHGVLIAATELDTAPEEVTIRLLLDALLIEVRSRPPWRSDGTAA